MKVTVHIGMPKTGSTSLQNWLNANGPALSAQGIWYQRLKVEGHGSRHSQLEFSVCQFDAAGRLFPNKKVRRVLGTEDLARQADFAAQYTRLFETWLQENQPQHVVISSEHIGAATKTPRLALALDTWLSQWFDERHYVVYFRAQEDWLLSNYSQILRSGGVHSLDAYLDRTEMRDYSEIAMLWSKAVGNQNLSVRLLESDVLVGGDLITDFAKLIDADEANLTRSQPLNEAFGAKAAAYVLSMNLWLRENDPQPNSLMWRKLQDEVQRAADPDTRLSLSAEQRQRIRARYATGNEALRAAYFPDRPVLFAERATKDPAQSPELSKQEQAQIGAQLLSEKPHRGAAVAMLLNHMNEGAR